jgi:hypothetical protein
MTQDKRRGSDRLILKLGAICGWVFNRQAPALYPWCKLHRRLCGSQDRYGRTWALENFSQCPFSSFSIQKEENIQQNLPTIFRNTIRINF